MTILRAQKPDGVYGDVQMDAAGRILVNDGLWRPSDILNYPYVGTPRTRILEASEGGPGEMLYHGAGVSGVVRNIWMIVGLPGPNWSDMAADASLKIWTGLGDVANPDAAPTQTPTCSIPLKTLLGAHYDATGPVVPRGNAILDMRKSPDSYNSALIMQLWAPIPFSDGILVQYQVGGVPSEPGYQVVEYELGDLPPFPYSDWRLRAANFSASVAHDTTATLMNVASGSGMLLGLFAALHGTGSPVYLENNWCFRPDGAGSDIWQTSGTEDLFGMEAFYFEAGAFCSDQWGCYYKGTNALDVETYRLFTKSPVVWKDGFVARWPRSDDNTSGVQVDTSILYYGP